MDAALQELGSGTEPDDRPLWGKAYPVPVKKEKPGHHALSKRCPGLIPSALAVLPENPSLIPEAGCGQRPHNISFLLMPDWCAKKLK